MNYFQSLSTAGFAATAISYGPARMGFGLFVPELKPAFSMSATAVGFISSLGFFGFFVGLFIAQYLHNRRGPEVPILSGLVAATVGLGIVAISPSLPVLAIGVFLAASSAGFAWTPFNDAIHRKVAEVDRPTALSRISTGTSVGIALAGLAAIAMVLSSVDWRVCWWLFAALSAVALAVNWRTLRRFDESPDDAPERGWRNFLQVPAMPLFAIAFIFGTTSAIYISFAADRFSESGGVAGIPLAATPGFVFIIYGLFGLTGLYTGQVKETIGLPRLLRFLMLTGALSAALVALFPGTWIGLISSAGLQGMHVMMTSAVLAFWSERLFPDLPSLGFTAALLTTAAGSVIGPALAGVASDVFGSGAMFLGSAVLPVAAAIFMRDRQVHENPARATGAKSWS